jgi:hypothetical protein
MLFKVITQRKPQSIVHFGLANIQQVRQVIAVGQRAAKTRAIKYTGVDLFEARSPSPNNMALREVHKALAGFEAKVRLIPGEAATTLSRMANQLTGTDLLVMSLDKSRDVLDSSWTFIPRMLQQNSLVLLQCDRQNGANFEALTLGDIEILAKAAGKPTVKAA